MSTEVEEKPAAKKVFRPAGGVKMQGFDPMMLAKEAQARRQKKNLDEGALEEAQGKAAEKVEEPKWETPETYQKPIGPNLGMLAGAGLAAALKKRQDKEAVAETLANSGQAASDIVEETVNANKSSQTTEPPVQLPALKPSGGGDEKTFEIEEKYFKFDGKKIDTKKKNKFKLGADLTPVVNTSKPVVTPEATEQVEEQKPPEFIPNLPPQEPLPEPLPEPMPEPIQEPTPEEKPKPRFAAFELKEEIVEEVIEETLTLPAFRSG